MIKSIKSKFKSMTCRHVFKKGKVETRVNFTKSTYVYSSYYQVYSCVNCHKEIELEIDNSNNNQ